MAMYKEEEKDEELESLTRDQMLALLKRLRENNEKTLQNYRERYWSLSDKEQKEYLKDWFPSQEYGEGFMKAMEFELRDVYEIFDNFLHFID